MLCRNDNLSLPVKKRALGLNQLSLPFTRWSQQDGNPYYFAYLVDGNDEGTPLLKPRLTEKSSLKTKKTWNVEREDESTAMLTPG